LVSPVLVTIILFVSMFLILATGLPVAFSLGGLSVLSVIVFLGWDKLAMVSSSLFAQLTMPATIAAIQFLFMAQIFQGSGMADDLFTFARRLFGRVSGGLAIGVIFISTIIAAISGISAASTITLGVLALPIMLKIGYSKSMSVGPIMAGGALGLLIPPSVAFCFYGALAQVSIGRLFAGGLIPGLILSIMYIAYIWIRCHFNPSLAPPLPIEERVSLKEKIVSARALILPSLLIIFVLGSIFGGLASPIEASSISAAGALVCTAINRKLSYKMIGNALLSTSKFAGMISWVIVGGLCFRYVFIYSGCEIVVTNFVSMLHIAPILIVVVMELVYMILGCFMDEVTMMFVTLPIFLPILRGLGLDIVWFGILFLVNVQIAYLTPPFGFSLFYMKSVAPSDITMIDLYKSIFPFVTIQIIVLTLVMFVPQLALWLPNLIFGKY